MSCIRKRGKESWVICINQGKDENGKRKRKYITFKGSKREAEKRQRELQSEADKGIYTAEVKYTVGQWLDKWHEVKARTVAPNTAQDYADLIRLYLKPLLGQIPLMALKPDHVEEMHKKMADNGLSARTIQYTHRVLSQALKNAVRREILSRNPCEHVCAPTPKKHGNITVLDWPSVFKLLEAVQNTMYYPLIHLAVYTGLRKSELLGLRWQDVDFNNATISVNQTVVHVTGKGPKISATKTEHSRRPIELFPDDLAILIDLKMKRKHYMESANLFLDESSLVFANADGEPLCPDTISHKFGYALKQAGLPHMRFYDLRHTHATLMLKEGEHPKVVSERLGHSRINITLDTYSHVVPGLQKAAAARFHNAAEKAKREYNELAAIV